MFDLIHIVPHSHNNNTLNLPNKQVNNLSSFIYKMFDIIFYLKKQTKA